MNYEKLENIIDEARENRVSNIFYPYFLGGLKSIILNAEIDGESTIKHHKIIDLAKDALEYAKKEKTASSGKLTAQ